jgi:ADP-ribosylglycohydrolase
MNTLPTDYEERVYAGVLGKIIGVYLGRPFEGWSNKRIEDELGEVWYYVHEKLGKSLVVADDDISGTFTFLRALPDHGISHELTAEQIGKTWLNYLVEKRTVLWWGGLGVSTEHTAYARLKAGISAPRSGSIDLNGPVVAEQIGAQIFIDGWAMVCPGDPEKAVALAGKAASVSHDGEAMYGAQVVAAIESLAFVEPDMNTLLDTAVTFIPRGSTIYRLIADLREWEQANPHDWRATFRKVEDRYGYDKFGGNCHMVPNHAVIILSLLHGDDDFQKSLMIANTAGWDTDCNSANVGCIMGIKNGLAGIDGSLVGVGPDWRGPIADRLYLPTADGGRCVTDAVRETYEIVNIARALQDQRPVLPNRGMRFHFSLPGSVQGFREEDAPESRGLVRLENVLPGRADEGAAVDERLLAIHFAGVSPGRVARIATPTFLPPEAMKATGYGMAASPTLYPGQMLRARVVADAKNRKPVPVSLYIRVYGKDDKLERIVSPVQYFAPGEGHHFHWEVPDTGGRPVAEVGVEIGGYAGKGTLYLDWMGWGGAPTVTLGRPDCGGTAWRHAWVNAVDDFRDWGGGPDKPYALVQNEGMGLVIQGEYCWCDYTASTVARPYLADGFGMAICVRGLRRYVAVLVEQGGRVRLVERYDADETMLAEATLPWELYEDLPLTVTTFRNGLVVAKIGDGDGTFTLTGEIPPELAQGAVALLVREAHCHFGPVRIEPLPVV